MKTNSINSTPFEGKINFDKKLTKPMLDYANQILDAPFSGTSARERIAKATYDINILGRVTKKTIHPKLFFSTSFNILRDPKKFSFCSKFTYFSPSKGVNIDSNIPEGAYKLNEHLTKFEQYKKSHCYSYNTFGEKVSAFFRRMFGIRK